MSAVYVGWKVVSKAYADRKVVSEAYANRKAPLHRVLWPLLAQTAPTALPRRIFPFCSWPFFPEDLLDQLLHAMKEASIRIPYKAVLTKTNCTYRLHKLMEEVKSEHDTING
ncbi:MAG: DUF3783 domain-containing protein [Lachnospiraceae bacterium]|nr:DUF3783 domain-containing protein [Lachnospiraceae bacterium]